MKVVITGGAGFIGSHAVDHFIDRGDEVVVIDSLTYAANINNVQKDKCKFHVIDIVDEDRIRFLLSKEKPDVLINFAAETHVDNSIIDSQAFVQSNFVGVVNLLNVLKDTNIKLCHISTDEVYGPANEKVFTELDALNPMNPYSATKAAADMMIKAHANTYGTKYMIVRPSNNFGKRQHAEKLIPKLINCLKTGKTFPLYGAGQQMREWTYVEDTVRIIGYLINKETNWNSIYNVSSNIMFRNIDIIHVVINAYNRINGTQYNVSDIIKVVADRPGHDVAYSTSSLYHNHKYTHIETVIDNLVKQ